MPQMFALLSFSHVSHTNDLSNKSCDWHRRKPLLLLEENGNPTLSTHFDGQACIVLDIDSLTIKQIAQKVTELVVIKRAANSNIINAEIFLLLENRWPWKVICLDCCCALCHIAMSMKSSRFAWDELEEETMRKNDEKNERRNRSPLNWVMSGSVESSLSEICDGFLHSNNLDPSKNNYSFIGAERKH